MKIPNKRELQEIALNPSSDINSKNFIKIYKKYATEPYCFLVNNATLEKVRMLMQNLINLITLSILLTQ